MPHRLARVSITNYAAHDILAGPITDFGLPADSNPQGITLGQEGDLWFTESRAEKIGRISPTGQITEFPLTPVEPGRETAGPLDITTGPEGNLWFTMPHRETIGRITPSGQITQFQNKPGEENEPMQIVAGPDGNLWFTEPRHEREFLEPEEPSSEERRGKIGRITPAGEITEFPLRLPIERERNQPQGITAGPEGDLWFTEFHRLGRITPTGQISEMPSCPVAGEITFGSSGELWIADESSLCKRDPQGELSNFQLPGNLRISAGAITAGPEGNLWFSGAEFGGGPVVGRVTPMGSVNFAEDQNSSTSSASFGEGPTSGGITKGAEGNIWLTEPRRNTIARIAPSALVPEYSVRIIGPSIPVVRHRRTRFKLSCAGGWNGNPCRGVIRISLGRKTGRNQAIVLAQRKYSVPWESSASVPLRFTHRGLRTLDRRRFLRAWVSVSVDEGQGEASTVYIQRSS